MNVSLQMVVLKLYTFLMYFIYTSASWAGLLFELLIVLSNNH